MSNLKPLLLIFSLTFLLFSCEKSTKREKEKSTKSAELSSNEHQTENKPELENNFIDNSNGKFKILKVDSISDVYMIYAFKSEKYYKILSKKNDLTNKNWERIIINNAYDLMLEIEYSQTGIYEHASGISTDDGPVIYFEGDSIRDFYTSPNIKGLYYNYKTEKINKK